jgi:SNF2 family DNA or RNA helicase
MSEEDSVEDSEIEEPVKTRNVQQIFLYPSQVTHFEKLKQLHENFPFAIDLSMLGSGKTYTASFLALSVKYKHVIVICPASVAPKWKKMKEEFGVPLHSVLSYQGLRSNKFKQPKHGFLHRRDLSEFVPDEFGILVEKESVEFSPTPLYKEMVSEGVLLILDEIQHIKNISVQFHAASEMIKEITVSKVENAGFPVSNQNQIRFRVKQGDDFKSEETKSRVLLLSGSPMDKKEHALHLFRALGVMLSDRVAQQNIHTRELEWRGMREIHNFCSLLSPCPSKPFFESFEKYCFTLFQSIFKPATSSHMLPPRSEFILDKRNAYYNVDTDAVEILRRGLKGLKFASNFDGTNVNLQNDLGGAMAAVMRSLQIIETGKIELFARVAREKLETEKSLKVVIAVNFSETIEDLQELLKDFEPLILRGNTSIKNRAKLLRDFEEATNRKRLLIANLSVASSGIDLDDKTGKFPRFALVSPNYSTITSYQFGFRFLRADTKSNTTVHFVFAKHANKTKDESSDIIEIRVLNALALKSGVMKEVTEEQSLEHVVFPGDHEEWVE